MLRALVESVERFGDLPPAGFDRVDIRWVIELGRGAGDAKLMGPFVRGELRKLAPVRGDRSGKVSEDNLKPSLLVDRAGYALGISKEGKVERDSLEHEGFKKLLRKAAQATGDPDAQQAFEFLDRHWAVRNGGLEKRVSSDVKPKDVVAFGAASDFAFERADVQRFWREHLREEYSQGSAYCAVCGRQGPVVRILPWQITLFGAYSCPISSFNERAFDSFGKKQTANSPLCFDCAAAASGTLQYLVSSERHTRTLARDESRGEGKSPLRNQLAVFWLRKPLTLGRADDGVPFDFEAALAEPIGDALERSGPPADPAQLFALYGLPWRADATALNIERNRFYLAVLSPNKSRLVVREWIDTSIEAVCQRLRTYDAARAIIAPYGDGIARPTIAEIVSSLKPWRSRSAGADANLVRALVRTAYLGVAPPSALLETAVRRFRIPTRADNARERDELECRQQALAAAIKMVLTFGNEEAKTLESLDNENRSGPYRCGQLLAVLEEAQLRASRWRINATLVDRFYGGTSTSPSTTLGLLLNQATQAHMPKIRKAGLGYGDIEEAIEQVMAALDETGGFPRTLTLRQQGEFALGFYHQRAKFRAARPKPGGSNQESSTRKTEETK